MYHNLQICGICGNASYQPQFLVYGSLRDVNGAQYDLCKECVDFLETRRDIYELRDELKNPVQFRKGDPNA